jgi:cobyrinic acid a,c-diamide synthase
MPTLGPRVVIGGTHSGVGKTTVAVGIMSALRQRGMRVAAAQVGPDYIDPGYHSLAVGRPSRNLDPWLCGPDVIPALAGRAGEGCDVLVIEGVMGLFDGVDDPSGNASTAHVAALLDAPVVLVVDASSMSRSVAALVHGYSSFDPSVVVAGVILNRVGSDSHERMLRGALAPLAVPVIGVLRRSEAFQWRERHLGLVPVVEHSEAVSARLAVLADTVEATCDLHALMTLARDAPSRLVSTPPRPWHQAKVRIAIAAGPAFSFTYPDNLEALEHAGAELLPFDPTRDAMLPQDIHGLYVGGGFPEVFLPLLADNRPLLADVRLRVRNGLVTWAECGGLLWLSRSLDGHRLAGVVPAEGHMTTSLTLGYRRARLRQQTPLGREGTALRGHEFHYSVIEPPGTAIDLEARTGRSHAGHASPTLLASYLHLHLGGDTAPIEHFVRTAANRSYRND